MIKSKKINFNFFTKNNLVLFLILVVGLYLRTYQSLEWLNYGHDQDLAGWIVKDIVENKHIRLIGQETSTQGVFIGPIFYYLLVPFYLLFGMSPVGGMWMMTLIGLITIYSIYYVFKDSFNKSTGLWAAFFYSVSYFAVNNDRGVFPTSPMILWCIWYFYGLKKILDGKHTQGLILMGLLVSLIWHLHVSFVLLTPLILVSIIFTAKKIRFSSILYGVFTFLVTSLPFILFEARHNFIQIRSLTGAFGTDQGAAYEGVGQLLRVLYISAQNISTMVWHPDSSLYYLVPLLIFGASVYLFYIKKLDRKIAIIFILWNVLLVSFFSLYSKTVSEYYLNGIVFPWMAISIIFIDHLWTSKKVSKPVIAFIALTFIFLNIKQLYSFKPAGIEYLHKLELVREIKNDAAKRGYPCVSVSYITNPGYNFGYRYLFWMEKMHVNKPSENVPVYTIVFPLKDIFPTDKNFGTIGIIYPDYSKYNSKKIDLACSGPNENVTDTMWGYTD